MPWCVAFNSRAPLAQCRCPYAHRPHMSRPSHLGSAFQDPDAPATAVLVKQRLEDHGFVSRVFSRSLVALHAWRCLAAVVWLLLLLPVLFLLWSSSLFTAVRWAASWVLPVTAAGGAGSAWGATLTAVATFVASQVVVAFARYHALHVHRSVYADAVQLLRATVLPSRVLLHVLLVFGAVASSLILLAASGDEQWITRPCSSWRHVSSAPAGAARGTEPGEASVWFFPSVVVAEGAGRHCLHGPSVLSVVAAAVAGVLSSYRCVLGEEALLRLPSVCASRGYRLVESLPAAVATTVKLCVVAVVAMAPLVCGAGATIIAVFDFLLTRLDGYDVHIDYATSTSLPALCVLYLTSIPTMLRTASLVVACNQVIRCVLWVVFTDPIPMAVVAEGVPCVRMPGRPPSRVQTYTADGLWRLNTHLLRMQGLESAPPSSLATFLLSWHNHDITKHTAPTSKHPTSSDSVENHGTSAVHHMGQGALAFLSAAAAVGPGLGATWATVAGVALAASVLLTVSHAPNNFAPESSRFVVALRLGVGFAVAASASAYWTLSWLPSTVASFVCPLAVVLSFQRGQVLRLVCGLGFGVAFGLVLAVPLCLMLTLGVGLRVLVMADGQLAEAFLLSSPQPLEPLSTERDTLGTAGAVPRRGAGTASGSASAAPATGRRHRSRSPRGARPLSAADLGDEDGNALGYGYGYGRHPDLDMSGSLYRDGRDGLESLLDRAPNRLEARALSLLASAAKPSEVAACKDMFVHAVSWDAHAVLHKWRHRLRLAEVEVYAGRVSIVGPPSSLTATLYRSLLFASAATMARTSAEQRAEVYNDATGRHWLDLLWTCTATVDALTVAMQVAAVADVAPKAAHFKPAHVRRGGHQVFGTALNEAKLYDPVLEQARWLVGGLRGASRARAALVDIIDAPPPDATPADGATDGSPLAYRYASQRSSAYAYRDRFAPPNAPRDPRDMLHPGRPGAWLRRPARADASPGHDRRRAAAGVDADDDLAHASRNGSGLREPFASRWRNSDDDASEYGLLRHLILRCRRSSSQKTQALFDDANAVMCAAETLSLLAAASLDEDEFGSVQHTLGVVLASLITCCMSVEAYLHSPAFRGGRNLPSTLEMNGVTRAQPTAVLAVLEQSVMRLVATFGSHLRHVVMPPMVKERVMALAEGVSVAVQPTEW